MLAPFVRWRGGGSVVCTSEVCTRMQLRWLTCLRRGGGVARGGAAGAAVGAVAAGP